MKQFLVLAASVAVLAACNSNKDKITVKDDKGGKATIDISDIKKSADEMKDY